jgi:hypothetical protein
MTNQVRSPRYIIDRILRSHAIHLICGPSGSNKTTWVFQQLKDNWELGKQILGYDVHPVPYLYISADRSKEETEETLTRVGIDLETFPYWSLTGRQARSRHLRHWQILLNFVCEQKPLVRFLIIDGFMGIIPARRDRNTDGGFSHIADFLTELQGELEDRDLTLLAMAHATKVKEDSYYLNPRERILGSAAWAAHASTIIVLGPTKPGDPEAVGERTLVLCPRNAAERHFAYRLNQHGLLVEPSTELDEVFISDFLDRVGAGNRFFRRDFVGAMAGYMCARKADDYLRKLRESEKITPAGGPAGRQGCYTVGPPNRNLDELLADVEPTEE